MNVGNLCTIYLVRHGQTEWNIKGLIQGHTDSPLTLEGQKQASSLAKEFKTRKFDAVFSSDLLRAKRTAEIIALEHRLIVETTKALRERRFGKLEGRLHEELKILKELMEKAQLSGYRTLGIETDDEMISRLITFLREIAVAYLGKTVLVVSHGGMMRNLLVHLGLSTYDKLPHKSVANTAYIKLTSDGVDFFVKETKGVNLKNE